MDMDKIKFNNEEFSVPFSTGAHVFSRFFIFLKMIKILIFTPCAYGCEPYPTVNEKHTLHYKNPCM